MIEFNSLSLQLEKLKIIFESAVLQDKPVEETRKIFRRMKELEKRIADRKGKVASAIRASQSYSHISPW